MSAIAGRNAVIADVFVNIVEHMHGAETQARVAAVGFVKPVMMVRDPDLAIHACCPVLSYADKRTFHVIVQTAPGNGYKRRAFFNIEQPIVSVHGDSGADLAVQLTVVDPGMLDVIERQRIVGIGISWIFIFLTMTFDNRGY